MAEEWQPVLKPLFVVIGAVLNKAWGDGWGTFHHAAAPQKLVETMKKPVITYRVLRKVPAAMGQSGHRERGPRERKPPEFAPDGSAILTIGQGFDYTVRFTCWAEDPQTAWETCERFQEFLSIYSGYVQAHIPFIQRIAFQAAEGDSPDVARWRVTLFASHADYLVKVDAQKKIRERALNDIVVVVKQVASSLEGLSDYLIEGDSSQN